MTPIKHYSFSAERRKPQVSQYATALKHWEIVPRDFMAEYLYRGGTTRSENSRRLNLSSAWWCEVVDGIDIDFTNNDRQLDRLESDGAFAEYSGLVGKLIVAIKDYLEHGKEAPNSVSLSSESTKNYFYLLPVLLRRDHQVTIDADTGFVSIALLASDESLMSALITGKGDIHYSYVSRGSAIVKISGTAKIRHSRDFGRFERVLRML